MHASDGGIMVLNLYHVWLFFGRSILWSQFRSLNVSECGNKFFISFFYLILSTRVIQSSFTYHDVVIHFCGANSTVATVKVTCDSFRFISKTDKLFVFSNNRT